jgi:catechol-2,3-dioxygenase
LQSKEEQGSMNDLSHDAVHFDTIGQIAITVRDLARSKAFYTDTLGMKFLFGTFA